MRVRTSHRAVATLSTGLCLLGGSLLATVGVAYGAPDPADAPGAPPVCSVPVDPPDESASGSTVPGSLIPPVSWNDPDADGPTTTQRSGSPSPAARRGAGTGDDAGSGDAPVSTAGVAAASFPGSADEDDPSALPVTGADDVWSSLIAAAALLAAGIALVRVSRRAELG